MHNNTINIEYVFATLDSSSPFLESHLKMKFVLKGGFYDAPYKVRCIKHFDVLTVRSSGVFIIVKCSSDPTVKTPIRCIIEFACLK